MRRRIYQVACAVSLLMCGAVCALWVRSRSINDSVTWSQNRREVDGAATARHLTLTSSGRWLWVRRRYSRLAQPLRPDNSQWNSYYTRADETGGRRIFKFDRHTNAYDHFLTDPFEGMWRRGPVRWGNWYRAMPQIGHTRHSTNLAVSHWLVAAALAVLPSWEGSRWIARGWRRRVRLGRGQCAACGYDLRASPDRCPECGTPAAMSEAGPPNANRESGSQC